MDMEIHILQDPVPADLYGDILHLQAAGVVTAAAVEQIDHCSASFRESMFAYMAEK